MSSAGCASVRALVLDARGEPGELTAESREHLGKCRECRDFASLVGSLASREELPRDYTAADRALERAGKILAARRSRLELALFTAAAAAVSGSIALAGALGYGLPVLAFELIAALLLPFVAYLGLRRRMEGGRG